MRPSIFLLALLAATALACSSDSTSPGNTISTIDSSTTPGGVSIVVDTSTTARTLIVGSTIVLRVHVLQSGLPVPSTAVNWLVTAGGGSFVASITATDSTGLATATWRVGDSSSVLNTATATIPGASVTFSASVVGGTASGLVKISPDSQVVVAGGALPLVARVLDRFGNPVPNALVVWTTTGGSLSAINTTTSGSGDATSNFTTNSVPATYFVTASIAGRASVTFQVVAF